MKNANILSISLGLGIVGVILLFLSVVVNDLVCPPFLLPLHDFLNRFSWNTPLLGTLWMFFYFSFIIVFLLSIIGVILGIKCLKTAKKIATFVIILNSINLLFSLLIAWLLFGLARGM